MAKSDEKWDMEGKTGCKAEYDITEIWHDVAPFVWSYNPLFY